MIDKTIALYVLIDDLLKKLGYQEEKGRKLSESELLTTALISALYFGGHTDRGRIFMQSTRLIPRMLEKSRFNRPLHAIGEELTSIFLQIGTHVKEIAASREFILDSFPIPLCDNMRIANCKLVQAKEYRGRQASMRRYFYGIKVQLVTTKEGIPVEFCITPGSQADVKGLYQLPLALPQGSELYADAAYTHYLLEDMLEQGSAIKLRSQRKSNAKRKDTPSMAFLKERMRKRIETSISHIKGLFLRKIHAVTFRGFLIKVILFLLAFQLHTLYLAT